MQWYERNPVLLTLEKSAMSKHFPDFSFELLDDGRASWIGSIESPNHKKGYHIMAVYSNNHPYCCEHHSSIKVYPISPDENELLNDLKCGERRFFSKDECDNRYMHFHFKNFEDFQGLTVFTAARALYKAVEWIETYEKIVEIRKGLMNINIHPIR